MNDLEQRITQLEQEVLSLKAQATIPYDVEHAFRQRLGIAAFTPVSVSSKAANSEDVSINEAGVANHTVLDDPDVFLRVTIANTVYHIPAYTS